MTPLRLGAVHYLNARPLVYGLDRRPDLFELRYDSPSRCAALLRENSVDIGMIPSVELLSHPDYRVVPEIAIASDGAVGSVALFSTRPPAAIRSIALDISSRTSAALLRVLCAQWFEIEPKFVAVPPDLRSMLKRCDAAMLIGDLALFTDHDAEGLERVDLGEEWTAMTGLPFVWAFWAGRSGVATPEALVALKTARDEGVAALDEIASQYCDAEDDQVGRGQRYLHDCISYSLDDQHLAGLRKFYRLLQDLRVVPPGGSLHFYGDP